MSISQRLSEQIERIRSVRKSLDSESSPETIEELKHISRELASVQKEVHRLEYLNQRQAIYPQLFDLITPNKAATYQRILAWVCRLMSAEQGYIFTPDASKQWHITYQYPDTETKRAFVHRTFGHLIASHPDVILTTTADMLDETQQDLVGFALKTVLLVPLFVDDNRIAGLYLDQRLNTNGWRDEDWIVVKQLAPMIAHALQLTEQLAEK